MAQTYQVRTITVGRATHFLRSDFTVAARREVAQGLSLYAYDLRGDQSGSLNLRLSIRYFNDFGVPERLREHPFVEHRVNRVLLDVGYLEWRPFELVELFAGRQWAYDALGMRDFDGLRGRVEAPIGRDVRGYLDAHAGRDVQNAAGSLDPDTFDVQGLPPNDPFYEARPFAWIFGAHTGMYWRRASVDFAWLRRQYTAGDAVGTTLGEERLGVAMTGNPASTVALTGRASYHTLLQGVDQAGLDAAWRLPWWRSVLSSGLEYRVPWFDSSSIFNLFGPRPHQGAFVTYEVPVAALRSTFETRGWARIYQGDFVTRDFGRAAEDAVAVGGALGHRTRLYVWGVPMRWQTLATYQTSVDGAYGGDQLLGDTRLRAPVWDERLFLTGRVVGLYAAPSDASALGPGYATTGVLGLDAPVGFGTLSLALETTSSTHFGGHTNLYASFVSEIGP